MIIVLSLLLAVSQSFPASVVLLEMTTGVVLPEFIAWPAFLGFVTTAGAIPGVCWTSRVVSGVITAAGTVSGIITTVGTISGTSGIPDSITFWGSAAGSMTWNNVCVSDMELFLGIWEL